MIRAKAGKNVCLTPTPSRPRPGDEESLRPPRNARAPGRTGLGIGPVGAAFYAWDYGVKRGDIRVLGAASYAAPVLSTLLLVASGFAEPRASLALAAALIAGGGLLAAKDMILKPR